MAWILGIDEAGYGPNLGPFIMSAVACRVADESAPDLWQTLAAAVRRGRAPKKDTRLHIDDSKVVFNAARGLLGLERAVFSVFGLSAGTLRDLVARLCPDDLDELAGEVWHKGEAELPGHADRADLQAQIPHFVSTCADAKVSDWAVRSVVVCPRRFNRVVRQADSKGAVLAYAFIRLLSSMIERTGGGEPLAVFVDKQGGRNSYASQIQQGVQGMVVAVEESAGRSAYRVIGAGRPIDLSFQPRADGEQLCVALASMVSKYLRELFMGEFNGFWRSHLPDLEPTAGYPADAPRYFAAIKPVAEKLRIPDDDLWRHR